MRGVVVTPQETTAAAAAEVAALARRSERREHPRSELALIFPSAERVGWVAAAEGSKGATLSACSKLSSALATSTRVRPNVPSNIQQQYNAQQQSTSTTAVPV